MTGTYRFAVRFVAGLLGLFFRRIEVTGLSHVPSRGGGVVVAFHPNGLIDAGLILACFPRRIVFGARHGLFKWPLLGRVMRALGTIPIYRAADAGRSDDASRRARNRQSLDALAQAIAEGSFSALFPEGVSHDAPHVAELKLGAARLYYRARALCPPGEPAPVILPVGLHYDDKRAFRSHALVAFHPPVALEPELADLPEGASEEETREHAQRLTEVLQRVLTETVHATESWQLHHLMHRTRRLMRAERAARACSRLDPPDMVERQLGFARVWTGYYQHLRSEPERTRALLRRVESYDAELRALKLRDHELDDEPRLGSPLLPLIMVLQLVLVYLLLPPLLLVGYLVNALPYFSIRLAVGLWAKEIKDAATIKLLGGLLLYPLTWGLVCTLVAFGQIDLHNSFPAVPRAPLVAASVALVLSIAGGVVALRYVELSRETLRALRVRLTRMRYRRAVLRLRAKRAQLCDAIDAIAQGIELPGMLEADGRVVARGRTS